MAKQVLLAICDSPTVSTGFGVVSQNVLNVLSEDFDIHVLGINYLGDPHALQSRYRIYAPLTGGDVYGFNRLQEMLHRVNPDVIWILNDPWLVSEYVTRIRRMGYQKSIVVYIPIDSPGIKREYIEPLNQATHVVSYTQWGLDEMKKRGLTVASSVIPHGVNLNLFQPVEKQTARKELFKGIQGFNYQDAFIVLYVGRNQPRKRVDLYPYIIAQWMQRFPHDDVFFYYHGAAKGDLGNDIEYVSFDEGVGQRLILTSKDMTPQTMIPVERLKYIYSAASVYLQVSAIEGWSLPLHEAMACKLPTIVPKYSAMQDWCNGGVYYVDVRPEPWRNPQNIDTRHAFIDVDSAVEALETLYQNKTLRDEYAEKGYRLATDKKYNWRAIGNQFLTICKNATRIRSIEIPEIWKK